MNIPFVQFQVKVYSCINLIFYCKKLKNTCFAMDYHIYAIQRHSWHLHKANFLLLNAENDLFCLGIPHLCNFKSELTLARSGFFNSKHSKRRVLWWNIAFAQFKIRVDSCTNRIFYLKTLKKTFFCDILL